MEGGREHSENLSYFCKKGEGEAQRILHYRGDRPKRNGSNSLANPVYRRICPHQIYFHLFQLGGGEILKIFPLLRMDGLIRNVYLLSHPKNPSLKNGLLLAKEARFQSC